MQVPPGKLDRSSRWPSAVWLSMLMALDAGSRTACCGTLRRSASWMGRSERVIGIKTVVRHGIRENSGTCDGPWDSMNSKVEDGIWDASLEEE